MLQQEHLGPALPSAASSRNLSAYPAGGQRQAGSRDEQEHFLSPSPSFQPRSRALEAVMTDLERRQASSDFNAPKCAQASGTVQRPPNVLADAIQLLEMNLSAGNYNYQEGQWRE